MKLTPSQKEAVTYTQGDSIIVAGAGSGKTLVLAEKISFLIDSMNVDPARIVALTFTEKAAWELKERIGREMFIGTIHAFAASLIRQGAEFLEVNPEFEVMDEPLAMLEKTRVVRDGLLDLAEKGNPDALRALEEFGFRRSLKILTDLITKNEFGTSPLLPLLLQLKERYQSSKRNKRFLDFQDLEDLAVRLLRDPDQRQRYQEKYRWIFVDEFQDTSARQWEIFSLLHDTKNRLVLVGDPRQSIYRFRKADPAIFEKASRTVQDRGGRILYLNENFRSRPEVLRFVNKVGGELFGGSFQPLVPTRPAKGAEVERIPLSPFKNSEERRKKEAEETVRKIRELLRGGFRGDEVALLFRTRRAVPFFEEELERAGIPYETRGGRSLLETTEVLSMILWLRSLAHPDDKIARTGLDYSPLKGITIAVEPDIKTLVETLFREALPRFPNVERNLLEFKNLLLRLLQLGVKDLKEMTTMIEGLRSEEARIPIPADGPSKGRVQLLTVHAAKGLEFPVVFLCDPAGRVSGRRPFLTGEAEILLPEKDPEAEGLKERFQKSSEYLAREEKEKEEEFEESKRLLYVALTRASELLVIPMETRPEDRSERRAERKAKPSARPTWTDWLRNG